MSSNMRFLNRAKAMDRWARWLITLGGISIIASMLVMIVFMFRVALPLFDDPKSELRAYFRLDAEPADIMTFTPGPYLEKGMAILRDGQVPCYNLLDGEVLETLQLEVPAEGVTVAVAERYGKDHFSILWSDGSASVEVFRFRPEFDQQGIRHIRFSHRRMVKLPPQAGIDPLAPGLIKHWGNEGYTLIRLRDDKTISFRARNRSEDYLGVVTEENYASELTAQFSGKITDLALSSDGVFAVTDRGVLINWNTREPETPEFVDVKQVTHGAVTSMGLIFGDLSVVIGSEEGGLTAWNAVPGNPVELGEIHDFQAHQSAVVDFAPSYKDKSFFTLSEDGVLHMDHLTSERHLLKFQSTYPIQRFAVAERGDGVLALDEKGSMWLWVLDVPHPDVSWSSLWSPVHYEGYPEKDFAWQSSSASDDFEPKTSLVPLLFGSLKGTFYGMLFSFPLAFFAAIYTSYMMKPKYRAVVKPVVELMAAVPSVVTGFLAALWLAPRLEGNLLGLMLSLFILPCLTGAGLLYLFKKKRPINGSEFLWSVPLLLVGAWLAFLLGGWMQTAFFDGNLNLWFYETMSLDVDQRNCVVIGFALGFAVIPIIFTISEDALYNVPKHMSAAALALGSSRWQTMRRVILPMASPGIFAATMIGFGRAVGETMIVLMATGNTPILSPSILNGMRTLSANIAVEIPEAPVGSSLYRILFLSAILLFTMTFVVNTAAEVVRVRLKKRYKNL